MSMQITTNVGAINAQRNLGNTGIRMGKVLEQLSSGFRINRAADDAAGLAISEKMRAQIRGNQQAVRNAQDGISMLQTAEGALDEVHAILQRMRELAVQAANGTYADGSAERTSIGEELMQLRDEIERISQATEFNSQKLLSGSLTTQLDEVGSDVVVGASVGDAVVSKVDVSGAQADTTYTFEYDAGDLSLSDGNGNSYTIDISGMTFSGETTLDFEGVGVSITLVGGDTPANIGGALHDDTIVTGAGSGAASLHIGANSSTAENTLSLAFAAMDAETIGITAAVFSGASEVVEDQQSARDVIDAVDSAIDQVNSQRGTFGAAQNRLEHTIRSLGVAVENLSAAESRIRDADVAELSSELVSQQILQQAGISVLSQANAAPQSALALLN